MFLPLSPDTEIENVDDDSVTELPDLQVPVRISEIRRNVQLYVLASASTPEAFVEPSASSDPPEPFQEPSPSPDPQELEPQPSTSTGITQTPAKTYELDKSLTLFSPTPSQASSSFLAPVVPWSDMGLFLYDVGRRIEKVSSDGHCLMYSIMQALKLDHNIHIDHGTIVNRIWKEINEQIIFYVHFICGERNKLDDVLDDVRKYIEEKNYILPVADLIVGAAANALNINIKIYENDKGVKKEIDFEPDNAHSSVTVHLLYSCNSHPDADPNNLTSHYDALVLRDDEPMSGQQNEPLESDTPIILLHDTTLHEDMYMDPTKILKDLSKSIEVSDEILKYNIEPGQRNVLDMSVYTGMAVKRVAFQPYAIDGNVVHEIVCKKHEWHRKHEDGRYWASTSGKNKDLKGTRRCSNALDHSNAKIRDVSCTAAMPFQIQKASRKLVTITFTGVAISLCQECGARKVMEYNMNKEILTIWHQGKHRCQVKPGHKTVEQKQKGKEMLVYIMRQYPKESCKEQTRLGAKYHLQRG